MKTITATAMRWISIVCIAAFVTVVGCTPESVTGPEVLLNDGDGHNNVDNDGDGHNNVDNDGDGHNNKSEGDGHNE